MDAVDYAREQFQQQQANIMQAYRGVAGASGIAALAQSLSNQAKEQAKETRIDIGTQLADNRKLKLREQAQREAEKHVREELKSLGYPLSYSWLRTSTF